jgi:hypothetical protein
MRLNILANALRILTVASLAACGTEEDPLPSGDTGTDAGGDTDSGGDVGGDTDADADADTGGDSGGCDTPNPAISCRETGCPDDLVCELVEGGCAPSHCACEDGEWMCTADCGPQYACVERDPSCPAEPDFTGACDSEGLECDYGTECCCGECNPSTSCMCSGGSWQCYATDACFIESCAGRACESDTDCEGGGRPTSCVEGTCAYAGPGDGFSAGPVVSITTDCGEYDGDSYSLGELSIGSDGTELIVPVSYGGGCAEHFFRVCWDGSFMESFPVQTRLVLQHEGNDDPCDAVLSSELRIPLDPVRDAWLESYGPGAGSVIVRLDEASVEVAIDPCWGEELPACPPACEDGAFSRCGEACDPDVDVDCGNEIGDAMSCVDGFWACTVHPPLGMGCNLVCRR